jgi:imidazolonepropionase-like amidohydrolase
MRTLLLVVLALATMEPGAMAQPNRPSAVAQFVSVSEPVVALVHVRIIDGTGAPAAEDQTIVIDHGKIATVGSAASTPVPSGARRMELAGHTVIPGLVGMHEHLFYPSGEGIPSYNEQAFSFPRLYLASGVTTARTAGSMEPYTDLNVKTAIDAGRAPGPNFYITGPYLEGAASPIQQLHQLTGPDDARRTVQYWASEGVTSFKAYMYISRAELSAAVEEAHKLGLKVTGHLCAIGFREAAAIGIDNLEHGIEVDTEFDPGKQPDVCPSQNLTRDTLVKLDIKSLPVQEMIRDLVSHNVAVTSTLAVFDAGAPHRPPLDQRLIDVLTPQGAITYLTARARASDSASSAALDALKKEEQFEYEFVKAGGLLMSGVDPTGNGGAMAGFGDLRNLELLVEADFTPVEAVKIATLNGAKWLKADDRIGSIANGKQADLVVIEGNPAAKISDVRNVRIVFKAGVGYDPEKLLKSVQHTVGLH